jgi:hypothetical protein
MRYEIPKLETLESLNFAKKLNELQINNPFTFSANMKWVRPFGMLFAAIAIKQFRRKYEHIPFSIECNTITDGISYAAHMGFFKSISERINIGKMPGEAFGNDNYIPISELDLNQIHKKEIENGKPLIIGNAIENESSRLAKILGRDNKELNILLTYLIREMLRNISEHSGCNKAWFCGQYWSDGMAEIAIIDEGIGIKNSLQKNDIHRNYVETDKDALEYSIKAGISKAFHPAIKNKSNNPWDNSGFGLYMASEICKELDGSFCLATGSKYIYIYNNGKTRISDTSLQGTAVKITISTNEIFNSQAIISKIAKQGEEQAKAIRFAFKEASVPSKGLIIGL